MSIKKKIFAGAAGLIGGLALTAVVVLAANGDNLASFDATVTAGIPACASGVGTGLAYDITTDSLVLSCWGSNVLERVDAVTHLNDGAVAIAGLPFGNDINAMAYDAGRNRIWACNGHGHVVLIDVTAGAVDGSIPAFAVTACTDGLAYDGSDDTLWVSPDVSSTVYHYDLAGNLLGSFVPAIGSCGNSGIAVGGPKLYLANDGCSEIYEANKDGSGSVLFASFAPFRLEDLECDNETFAGAGKGAIWSQDAYDRILNAWEIPVGQCVSGGGGEPEKVEVSCVETVNPHGKTVPPAGKTTPPGPKGGQNEDGYYELGIAGKFPVGTELWVTDASGSGPFGPFSPGDKVKITEAPGATASSKPIGSSNGQAGAIIAHITLKGDPIINALLGAVTIGSTSCLVPPPPK